MATQGYNLHELLAEIFWNTMGSGGPYYLNDDKRWKSQKLVAEAIKLHAMQGDRAKGRLVDEFLLRSSQHSPGRPELSSGWVELAQQMLECLRDGFLTDSPPKLGIYDHFKGGVYLVTGHAIWASGSGEPTVEYTSMLFGRKNNRLTSQWVEVVAWPDGRYRSRFVYRGPDMETPEPPFKVPSPLLARVLREREQAPGEVLPEPRSGSAS